MTKKKRARKAKSMTRQEVLRTIPTVPASPAPPAPITDCDDDWYLVCPSESVDDRENNYDGDKKKK